MYNTFDLWLTAGESRSTEPTARCFTSVTLQVKKQAVAWWIGYSTKSAGLDKAHPFNFSPKMLFSSIVFSVFIKKKPHWLGFN